MLKDSIKMIIPVKPEYVSVVRLTASSIASRMGFNIEEIDDIKVAIGEACSNIIMDNTKEDIDIEVEFLLYKDKLTIKIDDSEKNKCDKEINSSSIEEMKDKELGLFIIKTLMDDVDCMNEEGINKIIMTKEIGVVENGYRNE
ncbi:ATP-binding protein [Clostridiisalibacter paucivorans]|uniref:ATP-binding protein n=1 Tax=Clostridiisalibacter paucivorans TaxID=408753 RepID=UPI00047C8187|nr:ATP-binding protein [Clostridiisalibacter paucivorans]